MQLEGLGKLKKKSNDLIGNRIRDLLTCSLVPQTTTLLHALLESILNLGNASCCLVQIFVSRMLSKNVNIKILLTDLINAFPATSLYTRSNTQQ
jgi:hypothetical protein